MRQEPPLSALSYAKQTLDMLEVLKLTDKEAPLSQRALGAWILSCPGMEQEVWELAVRYTPTSNTKSMAIHVGFLIPAHCITLVKLYGPITWNVVVEFLENQPINSNSSAEYVQWCLGHKTTFQAEYYKILDELGLTGWASFTESNTPNPETRLLLQTLLLVMVAELRHPKQHVDTEDRMQLAAKCIRLKFNIPST